MDHRKLEYLGKAKRLIPRQARWALFFTHFWFSVTYRLGTKNGKAIQWDITKEIQQAQALSVSSAKWTQCLIDYNFLPPTTSPPPSICSCWNLHASARMLLPQRLNLPHRLTLMGLLLTGWAHSWTLWSLVIKATAYSIWLTGRGTPQPHGHPRCRTSI